jgi:glycosyltransferase involved in cell wall biosynthesis
VSGTSRYAEKLISHLKVEGVTVTAYPVRKIEYSFRGKPVGGFMSQRFFSALVSVKSPVVHAISPTVMNGNTNLVTVHDLIPFHNPELYMTNVLRKYGYMRMLSRLRDMEIVVQTGFIKQQLLEQGIPEDRIHVTGVSVDEKFRPSSLESPYPKNGLKHLVTVGDFNPRKRFDIIYDAVSMSKDLELYHIGPVNGWVSRYNELKSKALSSGRIKILGQLDDQEMIRYLTFADLFVYASRDEGVGFTPLEAMSCGTNVVVNDLPVFRELMGNHAFYAELESGSLSNAISYALEHRKRAEELIQFSARFSPVEEARSIMTVYEKLTEEKE